MALSFRVFSRGFAVSSYGLSPIQNVTVIGGGLMGSGIAQLAAQVGQNVTLVDTNDKLIAKARDTIEKGVQRVAKSQLKRDPSKGEDFVNTFVEKTLSNVNFTTEIPAAVKSADLVIEAIIENLQIKQDLFENLDFLAPEHTLLATNTSSLSVKEIGAKVKRKDKYGGLHFFNPAVVMRLLEVIRTEDMSPETYAAMMAWGQSIGKTCVTCKDTPGFIVNKLLLPLQTEAMRMLDAGIATAKDIDTAMKLGAGHPMGPLELADFSGLDVAKFVMDGWYQKFPESQLTQPIPILNKLVSEGKLGVKTGEGFYKYDKKK